MTTVTNSDERTGFEELRTFVQLISAQQWSATWLVDVEHYVWIWVQNPALAPVGVRGYVEHLHELVDAAPTAARQWVRWVDPTGPEPVRMGSWRTRHAHWEARNTSSAAWARSVANDELSGQDPDELLGGYVQQVSQAMWSAAWRIDAEHEVWAWVQDRSQCPLLVRGYVDVLRDLVGEHQRWPVWSAGTFTTVPVEQWVTMHETWRATHAPVSSPAAGAATPEPGRV